MLTYSQLSPAAQREYARNQILIEEHEEREAARKSLRAFTKKFWYKVVPAPFVDTWVIGAITEHMQALYEGEIRRLLINIYGRSAKSTIVSVMYPCWVWGLSPSERFLYVASTQKLALRDADFARDVIKCHEYRSLYGNVNLTKDAAGLYLNDKLGSRQSLGAESQITGFGANNKFFDDPNDANEVESPVQRDGVNNRFANFATRSDSFATDKLCVAQQRTHPKDVSGYIDELGLDFVKLVIPLEYKGKTMVTQTGWSDPRKEIGEVADEARFPASAIRELKTLLGYRYEGQANQNPTTAEGVIIKREWFPRQSEFKYGNEANEERLCIYWDLGGSASKNADYTVGTVLFRQEGTGRDRNSRYLILWQLAGQWDAFDRDNEMEKFCVAWHELFPSIPIRIESTFGLAKDIAPEIANRLIDRGLNVQLDWARKKKFARCEPVISASKAGRIYCYNGTYFEKQRFTNGEKEWITPMLEEYVRLKVRETAQGPEFYDAHDDRLDSLAGAFDIITHMSI